MGMELKNPLKYFFELQILNITLINLNLLKGLILSELDGGIRIPQEVPNNIIIIHLRLFILLFEIIQLF
jgi:hypothetical protein